MSVKSFSVAILVVCLLGHDSWATPPGRRPPNVQTGPGSDSPPVAGYRRTVEMLRVRREAGLPGLTLAPGLNLRLSGTRLVPVICVEYSNRAHHFETAEYQTLLFDPPGPAPDSPRPTFTQYYRDISNGQFTVTGHVFGWYKLPQEDSFYELDNNGLNERLAELLTFAFKKADADVDFGQFDNDGPDAIPNSGDDDGIVDTIFIIHSETGGECGPRGVNTNMWAHSFQFSEFESTGSPFETDDVRRDAFGQPAIGENSRIRIEDYTVQPALSCASTPDHPVIIPIGVFCHEYGHALGVPDLYDRTPANGNADSEGVGNYCLMASGCFGADGENPATPVHMSAWCKALLGWATVVDIHTNQDIPLEPVAERNLIYNIDVPGTDGREFFLIECRDSGWKDPFGERLNWDQGFDPGGIAVWHVDERIGQDSLDWPFSKHDQGQNDAPSLPNAQNTSFKPERSLVSLIQQDRKLHLERNRNRGDNSDLFQSGQGFGDDSELRGGSRSYAGHATGISVTQIDLAARTAKVRLDHFPPGHTGSPKVAVATAAPPAPVRSPAPVTPYRAAWTQSVSQAESRAVLDGAQGLSNREVAEIGQLNAWQVKQSLPPSVAHDVLMRSAKQRTTTVKKGTKPDDPAVQRIVDAIVPNSKAGMMIRVGPKGAHAEQIADLHIDIGNATPSDDAKARIKDIQPVVADGNVILDYEKQTVQGNMVTFPQVLDVNGQRLPLHGSAVKLYYKDNHLVGVDSNVISPDSVSVTGKPGEESSGELISRLSKQLKVAPKRMEVAGRYVYFVDGDPQKARIVDQIRVAADGRRAGIHVLVDGETGVVLQVE